MPRELEVLAVKPLEQGFDFLLRYLSTIGVGRITGLFIPALRDSQEGHGSLATSFMAALTPCIISVCPTLRPS